MTALAAGVAGRPARRRPDQWLADLPVPALLGLAAVVVAVALTGFGVEIVGTRGPVGLTAVLAAFYCPLGVFVLRSIPGHPLGRLMLLAGVLAAVETVAVAWSGVLLAAWVSQWLWWPSLALLPLLLLLAPDGRLPSPRRRALAGVLLAASSVATVAFAAAAVFEPRTSLTVGTVETSPVERGVLMAAFGAVAVVVLACLGVLAALVVRWRAAGPLERRQLACLLPAVVALAVGLTVDTLLGTPLAWSAAVAALPVGLALAVLRYRLHDLDLYVHRGAVWLLLSTTVVTAYAVTVTASARTGIDATLGADGPPVAQVAAVAVAAALLQPAHHMARRAVNRLLYGRRDEPDAVLHGLGRQLEAGSDPLAVLPDIAATIVRELRVPYVAVRVRDEQGVASTAAEHGRWAGEPRRWPMVAHGTDVGELAVAPRRAGEGFSTSEAALLRDLAGRTALTVNAVRSSLALARARDELVLAREEERRRLRRDLHDGVASTLAGTRMLAEVLRRTVPADGSGPPLLDALAADLDAATGEVRAMIDGLRPAALDDGLVTAVHALADRTGPSPSVEVTVRGALDDLPAAIEVAAYRIVAESVANAVKHSGARTCRIELARDARELRIRVDDDGVGLPSDVRRDGVGLLSIRERAAELGGDSTVDSPGAGTSVRVRLPLPG